VSSSRPRRFPAAGRDVPAVVRSAVQLRQDGVPGELTQPETVDDVRGGEALLDGETGVGELAAAQRRQGAQDVDDAVERQPSAGALVQAPLQAVSEQRTQRLAGKTPTVSASRSGPICWSTMLCAS
jgi:hypothetical protein